MLVVLLDLPAPLNLDDWSMVSYLIGWEIAARARTKRWHLLSVWHLTSTLTAVFTLDAHRLTSAPHLFWNLHSASLQLA